MKPKTASNSSPDSGQKNPHHIQVWDIPTRLFHWVLVALVSISFVTGKMGPTYMNYHEYSGVAILILVLFRLAWGFVGSEESRFKAFLRGPSAVMRYASTLFQRKASRHLGHNPLGGWSVILLLISLFIQAGTGLFANDDILTEGPLFNLVSKATSDWLTGIHHINHTVLLALILIHLGAILFYLFYKKENLIVPMITGYKNWHQNVRISQSNGLLAIGIVVVLVLVFYLTLY